MIGMRASATADDSKQDGGANAAAPGFDDFEMRLGDIMRGERATMGKSLLDVQRELRIRASYVAAIENCDISAFDAPSFIAGYVRILDMIVMRIMDGIMAIPSILLAIAMVTLSGAGILTVIVAIVISFPENRRSRRRARPSSPRSSASPRRRRRWSMASSLSATHSWRSTPIGWPGA